MSTAPTLTATLTAAGLTHTPTNACRKGVGYDHHIRRNGVTVFTGGASAVWAWLADGQPPIGNPQ